MRFLRSSLVISSLLVSGLSLRAAPIVADGGFEAHDVSAAPYWAYFYTGANFGGWHVDSTNSAVDLMHNGYSDGYVTWPTAHEGSQYLYLGDAAKVSTISQVVQLEAGHSYEFSFWLSEFPSLNYGSGAWVSVDLFDGASSLFGGGTVFSPVNRSGEWQNYNQAFVAAATGSYTLSFTSQSGTVANLDEISITDVTQVSTVPDAASTVGLFGGVLLVLAAGRRQLVRR